MEGIKYARKRSTLIGLDPIGLVTALAQRFYLSDCHNNVARQEYPTGKW